MVSGISFSQTVTFNGKYGQVEIGGNFVGAEFHDSRPLPSRISFYYPVANSIDLSTAYSNRGESQPFKVFVNVDREIDTIGASPCKYRCTPYEADFSYYGKYYNANISYSFCEDIPFMAVRIEFTNLSRWKKTFHITTDLLSILRTCQTYAWRNRAEVTYFEEGSIYIANFKYPDTDSASVIVVNVGGSMPVKSSVNVSGKTDSIPIARFKYSETIRPNGKFAIVQLIGSSRIAESRNMAGKAMRCWKESIRKNNQRVLNYAFRTVLMKIPDQSLVNTFVWAKAMLASNRHYIDGSIVPMPCPAEYN